jgi:hypothetical protein
LISIAFFGISFSFKICTDLIFWFFFIKKKEHKSNHSSTIYHC